MTWKDKHEKWKQAQKKYKNDNKDALTSKDVIENPDIYKYKKERENEAKLLYDNKPEYDKLDQVEKLKVKLLAKRKEVTDINEKMMDYATKYWNKTITDAELLDWQQLRNRLFVLDKFETFPLWKQLKDIGEDLNEVD